MMTKKFLADLKKQRAKVRKSPNAYAATDKWEARFMDFSKVDSPRAKPKKKRPAKRG
jgi:hypothetical protein